MNLVYLIDDDPAILKSLEGPLLREGYSVATFSTPKQCLDEMKKNLPAVAISDIFFGNGEQDGETFVKIVTEQFPSTQCIMISGESDIQKILSCLRTGAQDFLEKPISLPRLLASVRNAVSIHHAKSSALVRYAILGSSKAIGDVIARTRKLAALNESVLICGENGTGKELVAANLHLNSQRYAMPLQSVNCTSLNPHILESELFGHKAGSFTGADKDKKGYFEIARGSSLFIDEIGDFALNLQSKILRVVQEKTITPVGSTSPVDIDVRLIFATHHNLENMIRAGTFREDLYFRISTFIICIPPLRERLEDIDTLAPRFLDTFIRDNGLPPKRLSEDALVKLKEYHYPGNVRELAKVVKNSAFFSDGESVRADDIDFTSVSGHKDLWVRCRKLPLIEAKNAFEKELLLRRLEANKGDLKKTAESLSMVVNNLYRKLHEHGIAFKMQGGEL
jgi:two-component system, NtrC family, nitrogen regulation response regulator NtrX